MRLDRPQSAPQGSCYLALRRLRSSNARVCRSLYLRQLACAALLLAAPSYLFAETIDLFSAPSHASPTTVIEPQERGSLMRPPGLEAAKRFRAVRLSPAVMHEGALQPGDSLRLDLFPDVQLTALVEHTRTRRHGVRALRARVSGSEHGTLILSLDDDAALGSITVPERGQEFALHRPPGSPELLLQQIDARKKDVIESPFDAIEPGPSDWVPDSRYPRLIPRQAPPDRGAPHDSDADATIDVMIVYTPAASAWATTNATSIDLVISQAMERAQWAADDSNLGIDFHLVHSAEVAYVESGESGVDLDRLTFHAGYDPWGWEGSPRYLEDVHDWRDQYGADLVAFFARVDDTGGLGWLLNTPQGWPELGFHLTRVQQAHWTFTMIHEMGHNMGAHHHKEQTVQPGPGLTSYAAGWRWTGIDSGRYCSIMTYENGAYFADGVTHQRVSLFSTPLLDHAGVSAGDAVDGDNARTLRETSAVIASYRERSAENTCFAGAYRLENLQLTSGETQYRSEQALTVAGTVQVETEATLNLAAPRITFEPGFKIAQGGRLSAAAADVACPSATLGHRAHAERRSWGESSPGPALAPARLDTRASGLPAWAQSALDAIAADPAKISNRLLDRDGRWLIFETKEPLVTSDANPYHDIYRLDLLSEHLDLISRTPGGRAGNGASTYPTADASGELIAFQSQADDLVAGDSNQVSDLFLHDWALAQTIRITDAEQASAHPALDANGRELVYDQGEPDGRRAIRATRLSDPAQTDTLSLPADPSGSPIDAHHPALSADGRHLAYLEQRLDPAEDTDPWCRVHLYDRATEVYHRQVCPEALANNAERARAAFSSDARWLEWHLSGPPGTTVPIRLSNPLRVPGQ